MRIKPQLLNAQAGASARYENPQLQSSPIHVAADEGKLGAIQLLLKYPENKVYVKLFNPVNTEGTKSSHVLSAPPPGKGLQSKGMKCYHMFIVKF